MPLVLLIGGARSGEWELALRLAGEQNSPVAFLATAQAGDTEMAARIAQHRRERPDSWQTIEEPLRLRETIAELADEDCLVIDCLTLWTANALEALGSDQVEVRATVAARVAAARRGFTVVITNEVRLRLLPPNPLPPCYRHLLRRPNAILAAA